jgi:DNA primase large subunit
VPGLNFSAYLKSPYISSLSRDGTLGLAEMNPVLAGSVEATKEAIKAFHRERGAEKAQTVVERWKKDQIYPYKHDPQTLVEKIEREVFDIVAVKVNNLLPDFEVGPQKGKKLQLRMLRQAIEQSPEELQLILTEVLDLPEKKQREFAKLLQETSLTAIISASKVVADRLRFLVALEALLFDDEIKKNVKERSQLHRLLAENTWIFGEEFFLSVDDQSLTEVLRKHLKAKKIDIGVDKAVRRLDGTVGIIDLMLTRSIPCHRENELEHLIVELKRPTVSIGTEELSQIKSYAFAVAKDERFLGIETRWTFWIISSDMDEFAKQEAQQANRPAGMVYQSDNKHITIWAKTWSEVLHANRQRLKLFQQSLEINADRDGSLEFLRETYANILGEEKSENLNTPEKPTEAAA